MPTFVHTNHLDYAKEDIWVEVPSKYGLSLAYLVTTGVAKTKKSTTVQSSVTINGDS